MQTLLLRLKDEKDKQEWPTPRDWHRRRVVIAKDFLGGYCGRCKICEYRVLTFDHVPTLGTKIYEINEMCGYSDSKFTLEVLKCRLLCHNCHNIHSNHEPWP